MEHPSPLQALLAQQGLTSYRDLMPVLGCSKQQAHMYWHGCRYIRDPDTHERIRIPVPLGLKLARRLEAALGIPFDDLLRAVHPPPTAPTPSA